MRAHVMPVCRQGPYSGYRPARFERRRYPAYGCTVESTANGWHRGVVTIDGCVVEQLGAVRDRTLAGKLAYAAMKRMKEATIG